MKSPLHKFYDRKFLEGAIKPMVGSKMRNRREFVDAVEEYYTLNNRQWYRKRQLERRIAILAASVVEDVKKKIKPEIIKFKRYKGKL